MIVKPLVSFLPKRTRHFASARPLRAEVAPTRRCAARGAVLWGAVAAVLAHLGLAAVMEALPQLRDPDYGYRVVRAREQQRRHPDRPLVLVLGTSRTANGLDPSAAGFPDEPGSPSLFNFGLSGANPVHLRTHLARLRADGVKPAALLVELFPVTLATDRTDDAECAPALAKLTAGDVRRLELAEPLAFSARWAVARLNAWHEQRLVLVSHLVPGWLPWQQRLDQYWRSTDRFGFRPYPVNQAAELRGSRFAATRATYARTAGELRIGAASDRALRALVADCRAAGTPVAFFLAPESPAFKSWYTPESRAALALYLRTLSGELGCPVFESPGEFAEEDFADGHHLLPAAAARFTRHLTEQHLRPWLAEVLPPEATSRSTRGPSSSP